MRADRLISLMLMLHTKGRCTAKELAEQLEVSERTIYRDVDALGMAGIPVYAQSGPNGGVYLDENYRISLTGLSLKEAQGLFIRNDTDPIHALGLTNASTLLKLFAALPTAYRNEVERMRERFYVDSGNWLQLNEATPFLPLLQRAVWEDQRVEVEYQPYNSTSGTRVLDAYGLVAKAGIWYLVGEKVNVPEAELHTYRISRFQNVTLTGTRFERDPDFDLVKYWCAAREQFEQTTVDISSQPYDVMLRIHPDSFWYFPRHLEGFYTRQDTPDPKEWIRLHVRFYSLRDARMNLFRFGADVDILEPAELRNMIVEMAWAILHQYDTARVSTTEANN